MHLFFFQNTINICVYFLVIKAYEALNSTRFRGWVLIPPYNILVLLAIRKGHVVVVGKAFVWTFGGCRTRGEILPLHLFYISTMFLMICNALTEVFGR